MIFEKVCICKKMSMKVKWLAFIGGKKKILVEVILNAVNRLFNVDNNQIAYRVSSK